MIAHLSSEGWEPVSTRKGGWIKLMKRQIGCFPLELGRFRVHHGHERTIYAVDFGTLSQS
jgi:hypothetical protein